MPVNTAVGVDADALVLPGARRDVHDARLALAQLIELVLAGRSLAALEVEELGPEARLDRRDVAAMGG